MRKILLIIYVCISASSTVKSQDADSVLLPADSLLFSSSDSLAIFNLIDSLLLLENHTEHQLSFRLGYNSNILAAGRTIGFENFGLAPSLSYFSSFGLFADVSGFWSKDIVPKYYLTTISLGYMHIFNKYFSVMAGYDRYQYRFGEESYIPYRNSWTLTPSFDYKFVNFNLNYLFYTGDKFAHRVLPAIGITLQKKNWKGIKRIAILPSVSFLFGDEKFYETEYVAPTTIREALENIQKFGSRFAIVEKEIHEFGLMNIAINLPISITYKKWNFMFAYAYHVPKALPSESLVLSESSFLSANLSYTITLRKNKKLWD